MNKIKETAYVKGILSSFFLFNTRISLFVNLFTYILFGNNITSSKVIFQFLLYFKFSNQIYLIILYWV